MLELKIRSWWPELKTMRYFDKAEFAYAKDGRVGIFIPCTQESLFFGKSIDMVFSGFKDKEGVDIYDGDVLYERYEDAFEEKGYGEIHVVVLFKEGSFGWVGEITGEFFPFAFDALPDSLVIGNIYEKPELLQYTTVTT